MKRVHARRRGFTLVEVITVVGVILVVLGLALPAVQAARESARRAQCLSNLHQLGVALQGYHDSFLCFPRGFMGGVFRPAYLYLGFYSIHSRMLPYLDQTAIYDSINFALGASPRPFSPIEEAGNAANLTTLNTSISLFLCPTDGGPFSGSGVNYRGNVGVGPINWNSVEFPDSNNGLFPESGLVRAAYVPDGLSHTAALSERLRGSAGDEALDPDRDFWPSHGYVATADGQLKLCSIEARGGSKGGFTSAGDHWLWSGRERTLYCHGQSPNGRVPDCLDLNIVTALGMTTARSSHPGGVNLLMGDGSCRWVGSSIDQAVWRGLGTRNGGELVE